MSRTWKDQRIGKIKGVWKAKGTWENKGNGETKIGTETNRARKIKIIDSRIRGKSKRWVHSKTKEIFGGTKENKGARITKNQASGREMKDRRVAKKRTNNLIKKSALAPLFFQTATELLSSREAKASLQSYSINP